MSFDRRHDAGRPERRADHDEPTVARDAYARPTAPAPIARPAPPAPRATVWAIVVPILVGAAVAVAIGAYANIHDPRFFSVNVAGFSSPTAVKAWVATVAAVLAVAQLGSALLMYGKIPGLSAPGWIGGVHVWTGRLAVLVSVPVAVHCLYALGYSDSTTRTMVHSLLGCFLYGAFVAKMLLLSKKGLPGWAIPIAGGALFTALIGIWSTSALWFFQTTGFTF